MLVPVDNADWMATTSPGPRRTYARPGAVRGMAAASGTSMTSFESFVSCIRRAMRMLVLARMLSLIAPWGRWVASSMCTPRLRPRWATPTRASMNWGSSALRVANSSMMTSRRGMGSGRPLRR